MLAFPELVVGLVENASPQRQKSIQALRGPAHARALEASSHDSFTSSFSDATAHMHSLRAKSGIPHALGIAGKVIHGFFWQTATLAWLWGKRGQGSNGSDQLLNLAMHKQLARLFCPDRCGLRLRSRDRTSDMPDVLLGMGEVHDLDRRRKMVGGEFPNPKGSISQEHDRLGLL